MDKENVPSKTTKRNGLMFQKCNKAWEIKVKNVNTTALMVQSLCSSQWSCASVTKEDPSAPFTNKK